MVRTPTALLSAADQQRRAALRMMKSIALGALVLLAVVFVVASALEARYPALSYVRATAEGGMVGALADWFAVTALFRRPLGLPIPHTAIIPTRKDEIGRALGEFVETNFLSGAVVRAKLESAGVSRRLGAWLASAPHARRVAAEGAAMALAVLRAVSDAQVQDILAGLAREHVVEPPWAPTAGAWLQNVVDSGGHQAALDLALDTAAAWLGKNRAAFDGVLSPRLPTWVPRAAHRLLDEAAYHEAVAFVAAVRADPKHPAREAVDEYLRSLATRLREDLVTMGRFEDAKTRLFDDARIHELTARFWETAKAGLIASLADADGELRRRVAVALVEVGERLRADAALQRRVDGWTVDAAAFLVERYRGEAASVITDTIQRWESAEATEKIELMVGRDLQYIRLNGTIVGAVAGLLIFTVAHLALG